MVTGYYRWLQRRGGYLWIQSTATVSINHKAPHERNVIWVNYVLRSVRCTFFFLFFFLLQPFRSERSLCVPASRCAQRSFEGKDDEIHRNYWSMSRSNLWEY